MPICGKIIVPGIYILATLLFALRYVFTKRSIGRLAFRVFLVGMFFHTLFVIYYYWCLGYPFVERPADLYQFLSWVAGVVFILLCRGLELEAAGIFFIPASLVFFLISIFGNAEYHISPAFAGSPWAAVHVVFALIAFSVFLVSFVVGVGYIAEEYQLKHKRIIFKFQRLPSLEALNDIHYKALLVGFVMLTCAIVAGFLLSKDVSGSFFVSDAKRWWTLVAWALYVATLKIRIKPAWHGRRGVLLSILGFALIILAALGVEH